MTKKDLKPRVHACLGLTLFPALGPQGLSNLYTLEGGIINYLNHEGNEEWDGSLFVFDDRLAIGPSASGGGLRSASEAGQELPAAVPCQLCGRAKGLLPHMNCANVLCNKLFIACKSCRSEHRPACGCVISCPPPSLGMAQHRTEGERGIESSPSMIPSLDRCPVLPSPTLEAATRFKRRGMCLRQKAPTNSEGWEIKLC